MADLSLYDWNADPAAVLADPNNAKQTDDSASVLGDLALAIPRGAVGAVQDAYGLADTLTGDSLPDWTDNPLGESETIPGSILQGVANFATGFVPIFGQVSKIGGLSKFGKYAVAGALTDFTVWDGNEARLSNLLREHVGLDDPITEFLAADDSDPEIVGRLKNALEGLGVGTAVDLLALSLRGVKKYRAKVSSGVSKEVAAREAAAEIKAEEFQAAYTKAAEEPPKTVAAAYGDVPEDNFVQDDAETLAAADLTNPEARARQLRSRKRGAESIEARLNFEFRKDRSPEDLAPGTKPLFDSKEELDTAVRFVREIDPILLSDVGLSVRNKVGGASGSYDFVRSLITLSKAVEAKAGDVTFIHEVWHSLSRYVEPKYVEAMKREYIRDVNARIQATDRFGEGFNPMPEGSFLRKLKSAQAGGEAGVHDGDYRFLNFDEWFAETMLDKSLKHLDDAKKFKDKDAGAIVTFVRQVWDKLVGYLRAKGGYAGSEEVFNKFIKGEIKPIIHNALGLQPEVGPIRFSAEAGERPIHGALRSLGIDPSTISVEEIQKGIAVRARQFENAGIDPAVNPRNLSEAELAITALSEKGLNLRDVRDSKDASLLARTVETLLPVKEGTTWEAVQKEAAAFADSIAEDPRKLMLELQGLGQDAGLLVRKMTVARAVYDQQTRAASELVSEIRNKGGTPEMKAEAIARFQQLIPLQKALQDVRSGFGLGLGSLGHDLSSTIISKEMADKLILEAGGEANVDNILHALDDAFKLGGSGAVSKIAKETVGKKFWNVGYEVWMQGILSAPRTGVVSATSASIATLYRPLEMMAGSLLRGDGGQGFHAAVAQLRNLQEALPDAWKAAKSSWLTEQNKLGAGLVDVDRRALTAANLGLEASPYAGMIDTVGRLVRTPGRILSAQDEGFGLLNYRAIVKERLDAQYLAEAATNGSSIPDALARSQADLDRMVIDGMAYSREALYKEGYAKAKSFNPAGNAQTWKQAAKEYVTQNFDPAKGTLAQDALATVKRDVTLTTPLSVHADNPLVSSAARLQGLIEANPILKPFLPFIRTPTNIAVWAGQRFDVAGAAKLAAGTIFPEYAPRLSQAKNRLVQDMLSNDPTRKAAAVGRMFTGVSIAASVVGLAAQDKITGRGPKDPNLRKILEGAGWQPYSVKIGDTYYSYARIDPLATLLGTFADTYEWSKWAPEEDRGEAATLGWGLAVGMANNVTNKTYFTGLMRLTEVLSDPAAAVEKTARGYAGSAIPNFLASIVPALGDDYMREARTMTDAMLKKIPGYSDDLAPQRNLLGEPVEWKRVLGDDVTGDFAISFSPIATSAVSDDLIWTELSKLERAFEPPRRMRSGMDLTTFKNASGQDAYDRWQELSGTTSIRGLNLRNALRKLIKSPRYQSLPAESSWEAQSPRVYEIKNVLEQYRAAAFPKVLSEFPDLAAEDRRVYLTKRDLKRGIDRRLLEKP